MKIKTKIGLIILATLLIGCDFNKKEKIDNNSVIDENNTHNVTQEESYAQEEINLEEFKENMGNDDYGIKKETLTISDTSAKGKGYYGDSLKINYPYIYTIENDNIIYNSNTSLILNLLIEDLLSSYGVALNDIKNESLGKALDYNIAYKDNNFLSLDYSFNWIDIFTGFVYDKPDNMNSEFNDNISSEVRPVTTTINLYFRDSNFSDIKPIDLEPDVIKREDIISDEEIFEILDNKSYKLVAGVEEAFILYDDGDKSRYHATDNFLLKDDNKLQVGISTPNEKGIPMIEIDYNWKEKLESKYIMNKK